MPLQLGQRAPYATARTVISVLEKHRAVGLKEIDGTMLGRIGVSESLIPRTIATLAILDFTDENGKPTPEFQRLPNLSEAEFKEAVADMLRTAYAPVLSVIGDPSSADVKAIEDAFRGFQPVGQLDRMVQLFIGLMVYVGLMPEPAGRRKDPASSRQATNGRATRKVSPPAVRLPAAGPREQPTVTPPPPARQPAYSRSVQLASGMGIVTLSGEFNPFVLAGENRIFLNKVVDLFEEFESKTSPGTAPGLTDAKDTDLS